MTCTFGQVTKTGRQRVSFEGSWRRHREVSQNEPDQQQLAGSSLNGHGADCMRHNVKQLPPNPNAVSPGAFAHTSPLDHRQASSDLVTWPTGRTRTNSDA
jgi:hypothetical protein